MLPPLQPRSLWSHETICCGERSRRWPVAIATSVSICSVAENAQHEPHCFWSFTGVSTFVPPTFLLRQSIELAGVASAASSDASSSCPADASAFGLYPR